MLVLVMKQLWPGDRVIWFYRRASWSRNWGVDHSGAGRNKLLHSLTFESRPCGKHLWRQWTGSNLDHGKAKHTVAGKCYCMNKKRINGIWDISLDKWLHMLRTRRHVTAHNSGEIKLRRLTLLGNEQRRPFLAMEYGQEIPDHRHILPIPSKANDVTI